MAARGCHDVMPTDAPPPASPGSRASAGPLLWLLMAVTLIALVWRDSGLLPRVFWDEWVYSLNSRHIPLSVAPFPSYLYHLLFRSTRLCGDGYLECARLLNALLFVAALPLVHGVARQFCRPGPAMVATAATALAPVNAYTAYFMPEAAYFFGFWLFTWVIFPPRHPPSPGRSACAGAVLGLLALVKAHALFLALPAAALLVQAARREPAGGRAYAATRSLGGFIAAFLVVRLAVGYGFAGFPGLNLLGSSYAQAAGAGLNIASVPLLNAGAGILLLHVLALATMFAPAIAMTLNHLAGPAASASRPIGHRELAVYATAVFMTLVVVTVVFSATTANVHGAAPGVLQMRYYNFALPLLFIGAASDASLNRDSGRTGGSWLWAFPLAALATWGWWMLPAAARPVTVFAPELAGMMARPAAFAALTAGGIACLLCWAYDRHLGARLFIALQLPASLLVMSFHVAQEARQASRPTVFDRAGEFARQNLGPVDRAALQVLGPGDDTNHYGAVRALMHIDQPGAYFLGLPDASSLDAARLAPHVAWLLVIGKRTLPPGHEPLVVTNGYSLVKVAGTTLLDFSLPPWPQLVNSIEGLGPPGPDGARTTGDRFTIEFRSDLPRAFRLEFDATTFGLDAGRRLSLLVGDRRYAISAGEMRPGTSIPVDVLEGVRRISIEGLAAAPGAPSGLSGLQLRSLRVTSRDVSPAHH